MKYYPVNLDIRHQSCLVVGGGAVGTRKVKTLLDCGAAVTVVSPDASNLLSGLAEQNLISLKQPIEAPKQPVKAKTQKIPLQLSSVG